MTHVLSHAEFYESAMASNGHDLIDENAVLQKIAEKNDISFEQAKLAQVYYEQLQKDELLTGDVWYSDDADRRADAFKLAASYQTHVAETTKTAETRANRLLEKLAAVAEEWAEDAGVEGEFSPIELVKLAGLQAESVLAYDDEIAERSVKIASGFIEAPAPDPDMDEATKEAAAEQEKIAIQDLYSGPKASAPDLMLDKALPHVGQAYSAGNPTAGARTTADHSANGQQLLQSLGIHDEGAQRNFIHGALDTHGSSGAPLGDVLRQAGDKHLADTTGMRGFVNRNKTTLGVAGVGAGLGAVMYMKNKQDANARQKRLQHLRAQAQPQEGEGQPQGVAHAI